MNTYLASYLNSLVLVIISRKVISSFLADKIREIALSQYNGDKSAEYICQAETLVEKLSVAVENGSYHKNTLISVEAMKSLLASV